MAEKRPAGANCLTRFGHRTARARLLSNEPAKPQFQARRDDVTGRLLCLFPGRSAKVSSVAPGRVNGDQAGGEDVRSGVRMSGAAGIPPLSSVFILAGRGAGGASVEEGALWLPLPSRLSVRVEGLGLGSEHVGSSRFAPWCTKASRDWLYTNSGRLPLLFHGVPGLSPEVSEGFWG